MSTLLAKVIRLGAQTTQGIAERYLAAGQLAYSQLERTVGAVAWVSYPPVVQLQLAPLRGEYLALESVKDRIAPLGKGGGRLEPTRFGLPTPNSNTYTDSILEVFERRRNLRERQQCAVSCDEVCSLDFCAHSGKILGGKWQLLVTNEENNLIGSLVTDTVKLEDVKPYLQTLANRPNFNAKVAIIDNVPPSIDLSLLSKLERLIMEALDVEWVGQDRFHVAHSFSPKFNNVHPLYYELIIVGWRHATTERDSQCERLVDEWLVAGKISKSCTFRDVKYEIRGTEWRKGSGDWQSVEQVIIDDEWKPSGLYHELFSTSPCVIVPENMLQPKALEVSINRYTDEAIARMFHRENEQGHREPIKTMGKVLAQSDVNAVYKLFENAKKRAFKCCPPADLKLEPWRRTGEQDQNGIDIWKPRFHSCGTENWNSQQASFVVGGNSRKELATSCFYEGNARLITKKEVAGGRQEDLSTSNPTVALRCNAWAGHGGAGTAARHRLLRHAPYFVSLPPPPAEGEVCIQQVGRFDAGSSRRKTPPALDLEFAPNAKLTVSNKAQMQLQLLTKQQPPPTTTTNPALSSPAIGTPASTVATSSLPTPFANASSSSTPLAFTNWSPPFANIPGSSSSIASAKRLPQLPATVSMPQTPPATVSMPQPPPAKRKYEAKRKRVEGRRSEQNPWWCICLPPANERTAKGRTYHDERCPMECWMTDAQFGEPKEGHELIAMSRAGSRAGKRVRYDGRNWVER